nr:hypothetical protein [uncultured Draconibacterium sp.]
MNWIDILLAYKDGKFDRYYYGLTPKLLVGACQVPMESKFENKQIAYEVTKRMIDEMQSYENDGLIVTSNQCEIHHGPVMKLAEGKVTKNSIGTNFDKIWVRYGDEIIEGNFGINSYDRKILKSICK